MIREALKCNTSLTELNLCGGAMQLVTNKKKRKSYISYGRCETDNNIGDAGASMISQLLECNSSLVELELSCGIRA